MEKIPVPSSLFAMALRGGIARAIMMVIVMAGCASIPKKSLGVESINIEGTKFLDSRSLKACLGTVERSRPHFDISANPDPACGAPPFDAGHLFIPTWFTAWPWTEWPTYSRAIFERDLDRIVRWYHARGYYQVRLLSVQAEPGEAVTEQRAVPACGDEDEGCPLHLNIQLDEGLPSLVTEARVEGIKFVPLLLQDQLRALANGMLHKRFDELDYDNTKLAVLQALKNGSYARAQIQGQVKIFPGTRRVSITFNVMPGEPCYFGGVRVRVRSPNIVPGSVVVKTASIPTGAPFSLDKLLEAQKTLYELGAFSSVQLQADTNVKGNRIPIDIDLIPSRTFRYGIGVGIMSGLLTTFEGYETQDVNVWDVHLLGFVESRNALGGLQRVRLDERPRIVFPRRFPGIPGDFPSGLKLGNTLTLASMWPNFIENRTSLSMSAQWDVGPDPFGRDFNQNILDARVGPQRTWRLKHGTVFGTTALHYSLYDPFGGDPDLDPNTEGVQAPAQYRVGFWENYVNLDLRDDPIYPRKGVFFGLSAHLAGQIGNISQWTYLRWIPEARGYVPLPLGIVFATRVRLGLLHIYSTNSKGEEDQRLGPYAYRLRGGGPNSNRGFIPGTLGDSGDTFSGGLRRWELSTELRAKLGQRLGAVLFLDSGDVIDGTAFRFDRPQVSTGFGVRLALPVGAMRLDFGYRVPGLQTFGGATLPSQTMRGFVGPFALNFSFGEAF